MMPHHPIARVTLTCPKLPDARKDTACPAGAAGPRKPWGKGPPRRPAGSGLCSDQPEGPFSGPERKRQRRQVFSAPAPHRPFLPSTSYPPEPSPPRWCGGSSLTLATWHPLPTHLQEEATQSLECGVRQGREVSQSCTLQNKTHLFMREDTAALEPHKLAQGEAPNTMIRRYLHSDISLPLLCSALG